MPILAERKRMKNNSTDIEYLSNVKILDMVDELGEIFYDMPEIELSIVPLPDDKKTVYRVRKDVAIEIDMNEQSEYTLEDVFDMIELLRFSWIITQDRNIDELVAQADSCAFANIALYALTGCKRDIKACNKKAAALYKKSLKSIAEKYDIDF